MRKGARVYYLEDVLEVHVHLEGVNLYNALALPRKCRRVAGQSKLCKFTLGIDDSLVCRCCCCCCLSGLKDGSPATRCRRSCRGGLGEVRI